PAQENARTAARWFGRVSHRTRMSGESAGIPPCVPAIPKRSGLAASFRFGGSAAADRLAPAWRVAIDAPAAQRRIACRGRRRRLRPRRCLGTAGVGLRGIGLGEDLRPRLFPMLGVAAVLPPFLHPNL